MEKNNPSKDGLKNKQIIGNAGMYYVCYLLSKEGWNAMPTARNAKGIDIVAYSEDGKCITIQVKTFSSSKNRNITTFKKDEPIIWDYLFIVYLPEKLFDGPTVYVVDRENVKKESVVLIQYKKHYCLVESMYKNYPFEEVWEKKQNKQNNQNAQKVVFQIKNSIKS